MEAVPAGIFIIVGSRMIARTFFKQLGLLCVPFLECLKGRFVLQVFLRDVVIIQVDETVGPAIRSTWPAISLTVNGLDVSDRT